jgi:HAD superfamily hydrolase (TIGR01484 family)
MHELHHPEAKQHSRRLPLPLETMPMATAEAIDLLFTDIDDTLTLDGRLPSVTYAALEALEQAGVMVVPVTGRPAGWCDLIARLWPLMAVVGENGAFYYRYDRSSRRMLRVYVKDEAERAADRTKLDAIREAVLMEVPGAALAADQPGRDCDLAIDFAEDVGPLDDASLQSIVAVFARFGATAKVSSIHVNGWFGNYDKRSMCDRFLADELGTSRDELGQRAAFIGDSPNDAPMFGSFACSIGVANLERFFDTLDAYPRWITRRPGGLGFHEFASRLLAARK